MRQEREKNEQRVCDCAAKCGGLTPTGGLLKHARGTFELSSEGREWNHLSTGSHPLLVEVCPQEC